MVRTAVSNVGRDGPVARAFTGAFFGIFLVVGCAVGWFVFGRAAARMIAARSWNAVPCVVVSADVTTHSSSDGDTYGVTARYRYSVDGVEYAGDRYRFLRMSSSGLAAKARAVEDLLGNRTRTCWVNPADPTDSVLNRDPTPEMLVALVPLVFALIGLGGIYAVFFRRARMIGRVPGMREMPGRPSISIAPISAEGDGPLLLRPGVTRRTKFYTFAAFALIWNGGVAFAIYNVLSPLRSAYSLVVVVFFVPFVLAGVALAAVAVWQGLQLTNPRPVLTLNHGTVALGDEISLDWMIEGPVEKLASLTILLEGKEEATYRRGTSSTTDTSVFHRSILLNTPAPVPTRGSARLTVPADSMHSLNANHNEIIWLLRVQGDIPRWPDSNDEFRITVTPRRA